MFATSQMFKFYNEGNIWAFVFVVESGKCFGGNFQGLNTHNSDLKGVLSSEVDNSFSFVL